MTINKAAAESSSVAKLLAGLDDATLSNVMGRCNRRSFKTDQQVVRQSDQDGNVYLLEQGLLGVSQYSSCGREVGYSELKPGDHFGELSAIDGGPRSASVTALQDSVVTIMPFDVFGDLVNSCPAVNITLMRQLTRMVRRLSHRVYEYSTLSVSNRIQAELLRLFRDNLELDGVARVAPPPTHLQLAGRVSCNREAVSRELGRLEKSGILVKTRRCWEIPDMDRLRALVEDAA